MDTLIRDVRWAVRSLLRTPGTTLAAAVCLALGIGATTTVYTAMRALVLNPVPARDAARLVHLSEVPPGGGEASGVSPATWLDWRRELTTLDAVSGYEFTRANLAAGNVSEYVAGHRVAGNFFDVLGAAPHLGRALQPADEASGERVVVLSDALWQRLFGADPRIVGRGVRLDGESYTVAGVMSRDFVFPAGAQYWIPLVLSPADATRRGPNGLQALGRLAPGASVAEANLELNAFEQRVAATWPEHRAEWTARVVPLQSWYGRNPRPFMAVLLAAVTFVVLIGCANVANLLLARGAGRGREVAIRVTLGAGRSRILRQFLTESMVLALIAGAGGVLLALWGVLLFRNAIPAELLQFNPGWTGIGVDGAALFFTLLVSLGTGIVFGVFPAVQASRHDPQEGLRETGRGNTGGTGQRRMRSVLVAVEVALALVLVLGTGIMLRSLVGLLRDDPGFQVERVLTFDVSLPRTVYADPALRVAFIERLRERLATDGGAEAAALINLVPMSWGDFGTRARAEHQAGAAEAALPIVRSRSATEGFFGALAVPLLAGRDFGRAEDAASPAVAIVSRHFAAIFWPGEDPIGRRVQLLGDTIWRSVVGVVGDMRHNPNSGLELEMPTLYVPFAQRPGYTMSAVVRTAGDPAVFASRARSILRDLDADLAAGDVMTLARVRSNAVSPQRLTTIMLAVLAGIALVLAIVGVFGVMSLAVRQRADEIGVRMALGARPGDVLRMVVRDGSRPVVAGIALGLAGGLALTRGLSGLVHDVPATDPVTFASGTILLGGVAMAACLLPALRATRYDPARLLRYE
jgi:putative ABC transport system permease protein